MVECDISMNLFLCRYLASMTYRLRMPIATYVDKANNSWDYCMVKS